MNIEKSLPLFVLAMFLIYIFMMIFRELFNSDKESQSIQCGSREDKEYTLTCSVFLIFLIVLIFFTGLLLLLVREGYLVEWLMN